MEQDNKLATFLNGELTGPELAALKRDPDYALYEKIKHYSSLLEVPDNTDDEVSLATVLASKDPGRLRRRPYRSGGWAVAASIAVIALIGVLLFRSGNQVFETAAAEQMDVSLPDGSEVTLNRLSRLEYNRWLWLFRRKLRLEGEAYFRVNRGGIFVVNTSVGSVGVLGTQFNVKVADGVLETSCYEGKVQVNQGGKQEVVVAGRSVAIKDGRWEHNRIFLRQPVWTQRRLDFRSAPLADVLTELGRVYNVLITAQQAPAKGTFTGSVPADDLDVALDIIGKAFSMQHTGDNGTYQLNSK